MFWWKDVIRKLGVVSLGLEMNGDAAGLPKAETEAKGRNR
jgi:hypothetical protein